MGTRRCYFCTFSAYFEDSLLPKETTITCLFVDCSFLSDGERLTRVVDTSHSDTFRRATMIHCRSQEASEPFFPSLPTKSRTPTCTTSPRLDTKGGECRVFNRPCTTRRPLQHNK